MNWSEIREDIRTDLLGRDLKDPRIRLGALARLEKLLASAYSDFPQDPRVLQQAGKDAVSNELSRLKAPIALNSAEKSILNEIFRRLGEHASRRPLARRTEAPPVATSGNKLEPLASAVAEMLERYFGERARFLLEPSPAWLPTIPSKNDLGDVWEDVCGAYGALLDGTCSLDDQLADNQAALFAGQQRVDIWFEAPYSFILEYDEKQHFNQFRAATLDVYQRYAELPFDLSGYSSACARSVARPGTSGFARLRRPDPLFPPMLSGDRQDNRIRQRAFRDFLKDVVPLTRSDVNPTRRVGAYVLGWKRTGFSSADCQAVCEHLSEVGALDLLIDTPAQE